MMTIFANTEQLYQVAAGLFERMLADYPEAIKPLYRSRLIARLSTTNPAGQIWVNARHNPLQTAFGRLTLRPELDITLGADDLHEILTGRLALPKAVGNGAVKVRGNLLKVTTLGELFYKGREVYPLVLQDQGISAPPG
jgi:hypothetical protein